LEKCYILKIKSALLFYKFLKNMHKTAFILLVIGGLNWLLVGLFNWDIGSLFGGMDAIISRIIYLLVGLSAIVEIFGHKKTCRECVKRGDSSMPEGHQSGADSGM